LEFVDWSISDVVVNGMFIPVITVYNVQEAQPFTQWTIKVEEPNIM